MGLRQNKYAKNLRRTGRKLWITVNNSKRPWITFLNTKRQGLNIYKLSTFIHKHIINNYMKLFKKNSYQLINNLIY